MARREYKFVPSKGIARVAADLNIRPLPLNDDKVAPVLKEISAGEYFNYIGYITNGSSVRGNRIWYVNSDGNFLWSGNLQIKSNELMNSTTIPTAKILHSPLKKLICTQRFGERPEVYKKYGSPKGHNGLDFRTRKESDWSDWKQEVFSVLDGEVSEVKENTLIGKYVRIVHDNEHESVYLHLSKIDVRKGQRIKATARIGISGNSGGASEAPHLHFGYRTVRHDGNDGYMGYIDPVPYFIDKIQYVS